MKFIASKLSFDQTFTVRGGNRPPFSVIKRITVKGGSNVRDPRTLLMPDGNITELSDEDAEIIAKHPLYKKYEKNGMMKLVNSKVSAKSAKKDLDKKDGASQLKAEDFKDKGLQPPEAVKSGKDDGDED